jgi:hypothetical protein
LATGNPLAVRVGPGKLYIGPIGSAEPTDLETDWDNAWVALGYTDTGSEFIFEQTFEDVVVAEELDPVEVIQTARQTTINFALAELTAANMQRALNGGDINTPTGLVTFEPPSVGSFVDSMIGWEADDHLERWVFRRCRNVGSVNLPRRKGADKAILPMSFRALKPAVDEHGDETPAFIFIHDADFVSDAS